MARSANSKCCATPSAICSSAIPSLRPDDVVVICPDLARFEPFAAAVFGRGTLPVPVTVSDLSLGTENPVAGALAKILHTVAGRCTSSDVLAIAGLDPVRRRLGHHGRRSRTLRHVDAATRHDGGVSTASIAARGSMPTSTSARGRRRCNHCSSGWRCRPPNRGPHSEASCLFDDLGGDDVASFGRLAELVARLLHVRRFGRRLPADRGVVRHSRRRGRSRCAPHRSPKHGSRAAVLEAIDDVRRSATTSGVTSGVLLAIDDVLAIVDGIVAHRRGRVQLRSGRVTITGSAPVRNVPAKVVALLGFDEGSLQRPAIDGDDVLSVRPCVGERDRHAERRNLLLDALFAAEQALVVTCDGNDVTTNRRIRFAVQLSELLDVIDSTIEPAGSRTGGRQRLGGTHPSPLACLRRTQLRSRRRVGNRQDLQLRRRDVSRQPRFAAIAPTTRLPRRGVASPSTFRCRRRSPSVSSSTPACVRPTRCSATGSTPACLARFNGSTTRSR